MIQSNNAVKENPCQLHLLHQAMKTSLNGASKLVVTGLAPVVQRLDKTIQRINHYPEDSVVCFVNTYLLDRDLSAG